MDTLRLMLLSLLIGATVSTSPTYTTDGFQINQTIVLGQQSTPQVMEAPTPQIVYVTPAPTQAPTQKPAASSSGATTTRSISTGTSIKRELYRGCEGDDVRMLQRLLKDLGYRVNVDGTYGTQTRNAVISFQKNNGLKADGIAGSRTIRKLASGNAVPEGGGNVNRTTLSYGMRGQDVLQLQYRLAELGYYYDACSGNYLTNTREAVRWFQQVNGLFTDGVAGPATLSRIYSASAIPATHTPAPWPTDNPWPWPTDNPWPWPTATSHPGGFYRTISQGMSGSDVTYLQQLLKDLGYFSGNPTGFFGSATYWAVSTFQSYNGLYSDGIAGSATQRKLTSGNAVPYPGGKTSTPGPFPTSTATSSPGETCRHCGQLVTAGNYSYHNTLATCSYHYTCESGTHALSSSNCGHYVCRFPAGTDHNLHTCNDHYKCNGESPSLHAPCETGGHSLCMPILHTLRASGCGHRYCDTAGGRPESDHIYDTTINNWPCRVP